MKAFSSAALTSSFFALSTNVSQREVVDAIRDGRDLGVADLVAIETRRLLFRHRRGGLRAHWAAGAKRRSAAARRVRDVVSVPCDVLRVRR